MRLTIHEIKERVPLRAVLARYGHTGLPDRNGKSFPCLFPENHAHGDRNPSCNFDTGGDGLPVYHCYGCGERGDQINYIERKEGVTRGEAIRIVSEMGDLPTDPPSSSQTRPRPDKDVLFPGDLRKGNESDWQAVADLRTLDVHAVGLAAEMGVLRFGTVHGFPCWIVTDESRRIAEARRMDGEPFPESKRLPRRKAHTLAGSDKSWPVGLQPRHSRPELFRKILLVEGGPDLLAAYHFLYTLGAMDALPVALLGRECKRIHPEALPMFEGRIVRIYPHNDADGQGIAAARRWGQQLCDAHCGEIYFFNFAGHARPDGQPVSDLNDCTLINPQDTIQDLLP